MRAKFEDVLSEASTKINGQTAQGEDDEATSEMLLGESGSHDWSMGMITDRDQRDFPDGKL